MIIILRNIKKIIKTLRKKLLLIADYYNSFEDLQVQFVGLLKVCFFQKVHSSD
jgi:hypothetical protein